MVLHLARAEDKVGHVYEPCQAGRPGAGYLIVHSLPLVTRPEKGKTIWRVHSFKRSPPDQQLAAKWAARRRSNKCAADPGPRPPRYPTLPGPALLMPREEKKKTNGKKTRNRRPPTAERARFGRRSLTRPHPCRAEGEGSLLLVPAGSLDRHRPETES